MIGLVTVLLLGGIGASAWAELRLIDGKIVNVEEVPGMVFVRGGCFMMGCGAWQDNCNSDEKPVHEVCIDDFYMDITEVTQKDLAGKMPNPSFHLGESLPVDSIKWQEAKDYCEAVGKRLPTEAEWEYAARDRGRNMLWSGTNDMDELDAYAWYSLRSGFGGDGTRPAGTKKPNELGIHDLTGNVWEWVGDRYGARYYGASPANNPRGASVGEDRVIRGGAWYYRPSAIRNTNRYHTLPGTRQDDIGFRCARNR